jgi:DNA-binding Lrp family transcriptional regulator
MKNTINAEFTKKVNQQKILHLIREKNCSRIEIANITGLTRAAISLICDNLLKEGLIIETQAKINPRMMAVRMRPQNDVSTDIPSVNGEQLSWQRNGNTLIIEAKGQPVSIYNINGALIQSFTEGQEQIIMELTSGYYIINSAGTAQKIIF